jgi:hypothetical protein
VISGDPAKPEHFMMRVELPPGYTVLPYRRSTEENIVVLAGSLELGSGRKFDESSLRPLTTGSFVSLRANEPHFAMTKQSATVQIFGMGPFAIEYVDATATSHREALTGCRSTTLCMTLRDTWQTGRMPASSLVQYRSFLGTATPAAP